ncbi:MAG: hypothetical protein KAX65_10925, partial [Caldilineaceae bacterium]|nr:hypothetical protein [Caldilineaceae bacterium]
SATTVRRILYEGGYSLTQLLADANLGFFENSGLAITSQDPPHAVYNPMTDVWLTSWTTPSGLGTGVVYSLWRPDLSGRIVADQKVTMSSSNFNTRAQSCPLLTSQVAANLRFEELPGATFFADSSGRGNDATCSGASCPVAALAGAVDNLGNAAGTPASDYALGFDGGDDTITLTNPFRDLRQTFSLSFWYKAGATASSAPFTIANVAPSGNTALQVLVDNTAGRIEFALGGAVISATATLNDSRWHHIVATRDDFDRGRLALYLDGNTTPIASRTTSSSVVLGANFQIGGGGTAVALDEFQIFTAALAAATVRDLYTRSLQSYCVGSNYNLGQYAWRKLHVSQPDVRGGKLTASNRMTLIIDGDTPTSVIGGLSAGQYLLGNTIHTIGGNAEDATSGVAAVEVGVNGGAFAPATGAATWAYNLAVAEGSYALQSRATDVAGNVETPGSGLTVIADAAPPAVTLGALPATAITPTHNGAGQWFVALSGAASDPNVGILPGSGVVSDSVEVRLVAHAGDDSAQGAGWQPATLSGATWTIDYLFADALVDPTGVYTVAVRAADHVGNRTADDAATGTLRLDGVAPRAALRDAARDIVTDTVTIGGVITDTGPAGVKQVEIAYVPLEAIAALPANVSNEDAQALLDAAGRVWLPAALVQAGAGVTATTWSAQIPAGLEGEYQVDLRGTDMLDNRGVSPGVWRGVIDTLAPRLVMTGTSTGATYFDSIANVERYEFIYTCSAEDRYLVEQDFACDGNAFQPPQRFFSEDAAVQALFPDRTILSKLVNTYSIWEDSRQPRATVSACDAFGRCATLNNPQPTVRIPRVAAEPLTFAATPEPGAPRAVVVAPGNLRYVASTGALPVTVAAEAALGLKEVALELDGVAVTTLAFSQTELVTRTQRTTPITVTGVATHTLVARATDWGNATQAEVYTVTFWLDAQPPAVTLDTVALTVADTWQLGSDMLRFHGTASDDVGLAAVQIMVDGQPFVNATFGGGLWRTAVPVVNPEGRQLAITVRAIDFAGQVTTVTRTLLADLSVVDAPDTTISAGPLNPSTVNTATFTFAGSPGGREVVAFACQLDAGAFIPCSSPWIYSDLSKGEHTFRVRAIDAAGYVDLSPASYAWRVDASALDATITSGPNNPAASRDASFTFTGNGASFECSLDEAAFAPCTSPQAYS